MQLIKPAVRMLDTSDPMKLIELAGRTCWKSEGRITEDSAEPFVQSIIKKGHHAMIEFSNFAFAVNPNMYLWLTQVPNHPYIRLSEEGRFVVSGSARAFIEFYLMNPGMWSALIIKTLQNIEPKLFESIELDSTIRSGLLPLTNHIKQIHTDDMENLEYLTHHCFGYHIICDRGVTHEIVRHRPFSYAQESTRYVTYTSGATYIIPPWLDLTPGKYEILDMSIYMVNDKECTPGLAPDTKNWLHLLYETECIYKSLVKKYEWSAQKARSVLPNALKTEINVYGNVQQWSHFFDLRTNTKAHPQMQEVANMIKADLVARELVD